MGAKLPVCTRRKHEHSIAIPRPKGAGSEGAKISPEGKILLLPNGRQGRRPFEAQKSIPHSAECGKGFALDPQAFEKA